LGNFLKNIVVTYLFRRVSTWLLSLYKGAVKPAAIEMKVN